MSIESAALPHRYTITLSCPDKPGIVAAVSGFIASLGGSITESSQHSEAQSGYFFMRVEIDAATMPLGVDALRQAFASIALRFEMNWKLFDSAHKKRVVILVSKLDHCLSDLLYRWRNQDFAFDIPCVISNHELLRSFVEWHGIPFHYVPVTATNKAEAYQQMAGIFDEVQGDVMVLARYMQILSPELCRRYSGRIINIHHSFLPSFIGAKPYHQAFDRGVKLIGATCHYVTEELDAGPIIEQDVIRVDHSHRIDDMVRLGKDVEKNVLARGLACHVEDRVIIHQNKTLVFA